MKLKTLDSCGLQLQGHLKDSSEMYHNTMKYVKGVEASSVDTGQ